MKSKAEILSYHTGYSEKQLDKRESEAILQPFDCLEAMEQYANQSKDRDNLSTPLPSDEEIEEYFNTIKSNNEQWNNIEIGRREGARWMRDNYPKQIDWDELDIEF